MNINDLNIMKKTILTLSIIISIIIVSGCGTEQEKAPEAQNTVEKIQQDDDTLEQNDVAEEVARQAEQNAKRDEQLEKDQDLFNKMGQEGEITEDDCYKLQDPEFREGCLELVELESS